MEPAVWLWIPVTIWAAFAQTLRNAAQRSLTDTLGTLGATLVRDEIAETLTKGGYLAHGYTYSGHPAATAAALANLEIIEKEKLVERVRDDVGPYFQKKLQSLAGHRAVSEARGFGLIGALEVVPRGGRAELTPTTLLGVKAAALVREEGVIVRGIRDLVALAPPLVVTHEEVDRIFAAVEKGLDRLWD